MLPPSSVLRNPLSSLGSSQGRQSQRPKSRGKERDPNLDSVNSEYENGSSKWNNMFLSKVGNGIMGKRNNLLEGYRFFNFSSIMI
jgi:hypothetical protein